MKRRYFLLVLALLIVVGGCFRMHNLIRFKFMQNYRPMEVKLNPLAHIDEGAFEVYVYSINRTWNSRLVAACNKLFSDEIIVFKIPVAAMHFENVTEAPIGPDNRMKFDCWFNTQYFMENLQPCEGWKDNQLLLGKPRFENTTIAIDSNGKPEICGRCSVSSAQQLFECSHTHRDGQKQTLNMDNLNYRSYLAVTTDYVYYAVGNNNSLVSCSDADELMKFHGISQWIITDGGTSIDYFFRGKNNVYQFSSVPFRSGFSGWTSPYYMAADNR
jgi:hypothetical protein